ncbi:MAG TPA: site-specific integrase [Aestuariivirga sp.]|nr:site-specific integrase [Aestuariivirga sp.]
MTSTRKRITKSVIDKLKPGEIVWDSKLTGFGVRYQRRDKVFIYKCRIGNRQRWFSIGKFGQPWTVDAAENRVKVIQGDIAKDIDPASIRDERLRNPTLEEAGEAFLETVISKKREATQVLYRDFFERLAYPKLGKTKVAEIKFSEISALHYSLRKTPITANRTVAALSSFFSWCERQGHRTKQSNPAKGVEKFEEKSRERFLSARELARLGTALARAERNKTESNYALAAIRLLIFTGCRRNEILGLRWKDVSLEKAMLLLPDTKTIARPVYLSAPAIAVLSSLPTVAKNPYVIVGERTGQHLVNVRKVWLRICKVARFKGVRLHDLRHSFASVGVSGGASLPIIGKLLGHAKSSTTEKYSHLSADPVRAVNEAMGNQIAAMLHGKKGKVVPLKSKASG